MEKQSRIRADSDCRENMDNAVVNIPPEFVQKAYNILKNRCEPHIIENIQEFFPKLLDGKRGKYREKHGFAPINITIAPTDWCPLACADCYSVSSSQNSTRLKNGTINKIIKEVKEKWEVPFITLSGGEPLIHSINIAKNHPEILFQVYTNAVLIKDREADRIVEAGNLIPLISIEGYEKETDSKRGKGVYKNSIQVMDLLTKKRALWGFSFTIAQSNARLLYDVEFIDLLLSKGALIGRFITYMPVGRNSSLDKVPTAEQREKVTQTLQEAQKQRNFLVIDYLNNPGILNGCGAAGIRYLYINPEGDIHPCVFIEQKSKYNINQVYEGKYKRDGIECLEDVVKNDPLFIETRRRAKNTHNEPCLVLRDRL